MSQPGVQERDSDYLPEEKKERNITVGSKCQDVASGQSRQETSVLQEERDEIQH